MISINVPPIISKLNETNRWGNMIGTWPRGTPLCKPYRYLPPLNGRVFAPFWSGNGYGLQRNYGCVSTCSSFQFQRNKKESVTWIRNGFFCCCSFNLTNDDMISVLCKHVMLRFVTTSGSENGCGKWYFLVWNRIRIWRTGRHIPTKNSQENPSGKYGRNMIAQDKFGRYINNFSLLSL